LIGYKQEYKLPKEKLHMYQMTTKPPEMLLNDCIVQYKQTDDELFMLYFLHFYEPRLNNRAEGFCLQYGYLHHFQDIKQAMIEAILEKIDSYDPAIGASLLTYAHKHIEAAAHDYVRQNCGATSPSEYSYDNLRKIVAITNNMPEATEAERLQAAMDITGLSEEQVYQHLQHSEQFRNPIDINSGSRNKDDGFLPLAERIGGGYSNPETIVLKRMLYEALINEVDALPYKEYHLLLDYCGMRRHNDWFASKKPVDPIILAARLHVGTLEAVNDNFRSAAAIIRMELEKAHWLEGEHTPELKSPVNVTIPKLSNIECKIIKYAKRQWRESSTSAEFHILMGEERVIDGRFIRELLKLWLY